MSTTSFGTIERQLAHLLSPFPGVKRWGKRVWGKLAYRLYKKDYLYKAEFPVVAVLASEAIRKSGGQVSVQEDAGVGTSVVPDVVHKSGIVATGASGVSGGTVSDTAAAGVAAGTADERESFFGYYDKTPVSATGTLLCHLSEMDTSRRPDPARPVQLGLVEPGTEGGGKAEPGGKESVETDPVKAESIKAIPTETNVVPTEPADTNAGAIDPEGKKLLRTFTSSAYNWQQGTRAQWLTDDLFIFNDYDETAGYISRVISAGEGKELRRFSRPVQDAFGTDYFLSLNYRRLLALSPDYGYYNLPPLSPDEVASLTSDGIWRVDYERGESRLIFTLQQIVETQHQEHFNRAVHWVNHLMISPEGDRFIAIHRCLQDGRRYDRLLMANSDGTGLQVVSSFGMVSHCVWVEGKTVIAYMRGPDGTDGYWQIDLGTGTETGIETGAEPKIGSKTVSGSGTESDLAEVTFTRFAGGRLNKYGDGHPHVKGEWFVTDTYPDRARMQSLLYGNWKTGDIRKVGEFFHGFSWHGETRCDLHPRLSPDGKTIFFDALFEGRRTLYRMEPDL